MSKFTLFRSATMRDFRKTPEFGKMMDFEGFPMKIQMLQKMTKMMDLADLRRLRKYAEIDSPKIQKRVRKIPKSNKKVSSEAILLII